MRGLHRTLATARLRGRSADLDREDFIHVHGDSARAEEPLVRVDLQRPDQPEQRLRLERASAEHGDAATVSVALESHPWLSDEERARGVAMPHRVDQDRWRTKKRSRQVFPPKYHVRVAGARSRLIASGFATIVASMVIGAPSDDAVLAASGTHWAFVAPTRPGVPASDASWARTPIDAFVLDRLEREVLEPSPEADRRTLIRRLSLDLTGLPPTPAEVRAFVADTSDDAYERVVDRLLARPQFGERMALRWLDLARYADTNGYSIDGGRHMWAWRDWVIDAYNDNMPFDRFTVEQLAGDLLPDATVSQRIASGFNRNHMNTHEGGTIAEEYRVAYVADRVKTTAVTWMGLTMACAQCHDHKYDPFSQRDYYRFFAYFNTITDKGNDGDGGVNSVPFLPVYSDEQQATLASLRDDLRTKRRELTAPDLALAVAQRDWEREQAGREYTPPVLGDWHLFGPVTGGNANRVFETAFGPEQGVELAATTEDGTPLWTHRPDLVDGTAHALTGQRRAWYLHRTIETTAATSVDCSFGSDDAIRVWLNGTLVIDRNVRRGVAADQELATLDLRAGTNELLVKIVNDGGPGGMYFRAVRSGLPDAVIAALAIPENQRKQEERMTLRRYYRSTAPGLESLRAEIAGVEAQVKAIEDAPATTVMVMEEMAEPRMTYVLDRGQYDARGEAVTPGTPESLSPLPAGAPANRLGLAQLLVDPSHPLPARVAVNGFW
ncbi:MAG: DUF1549 domain-containing protein, partial [Planctomycetota bacterium]